MHAHVNGNQLGTLQPSYRVDIQQPRWGCRRVVALLSRHAWRAHMLCHGLSRLLRAKSLCMPTLYNMAEFYCTSWCVGDLIMVLTCEQGRLQRRPYRNPCSAVLFACHHGMVSLCCILRMLTRACQSSSSNRSPKLAQWLSRRNLWNVQWPSKGTESVK